MTINSTFYLSKKKVSQAGEFIMEHGRDIEKALFMHHFKNEPSSSVVSILEGYINQDGGAGHLELDMLYKGTTPVSCSIFFAIVHELKINAEFGAINTILEYLKKNIREKNCWRSVEKQVMDAPRAIWWNWDYEDKDIFTFNPTSELIGYFYHFGGGDYRAFAKELLDVLYAELVQKFVGTLEMHDVISLMQLCRALPDVAAERFIVILKPHLNEMLITDKKEWTGYVMSPLSVFKSPLDPLYYDFEKEINLNLDYEITMRTEDGVWEPNWHWGQYDEEFEKRKNKITSYVTMNKLIQFKNFNRIMKRG